MATKYSKKKETATYPIKIRPSLALRLQKVGRMGETYSDVIERVLFEKELEKANGKRRI